MLIRCEICFSDIARINEEDIKPPFHGSMFSPIYANAHMPDPFRYDAPWVDLRCPVCNFRPFLSESRIMDSTGKYHGYSHECPTCHEYFKSPQALAGHKNKHRSD